MNTTIVRTFAITNAGCTRFAVGMMAVRGFYRVRFVESRDRLGVAAAELATAIYDYGVSWNDIEDLVAVHCDDGTKVRCLRRIKP